MAFKSYYPRHGKGVHSSEVISLSRGFFYFSRKLIYSYDLMDKMFVELFFDDENGKRIGFKFLKEKTNASLTRSKSNGTVNAKAFFNCFDIPYPKQITPFQVFFSEEEKLFFIDVVKLYIDHRESMEGKK